MYWAKKEALVAGKIHHGSSILGETLAGRFGLRQGADFTEWMMGFPIGYTSIDFTAWETPLFRRSRGGSVKPFACIRKRFG
jgi:hypothetical protein